MGKIAVLKRLLSLVAALVSLAVVPVSASAYIQLGAFTPGAPANGEALARYAAMVGRQPDIVMWYRNFPRPLLQADEIANLRATGQTPMVTWEPQAASLTEIAAGAYDEYLHESAALAKSWEGPLLLRFAHEMNGDWYSWGSGATTPGAFIAAWQHVVSLFRADGAVNVRWVWSPFVAVGDKYPIAPYFPGDEWIDYVGLDGYNWGSATGTWQSLKAVFASSYALVTGLSAKPVIVTETGSSETGGDKAAWIRTGFMTTIPEAFPRIGAVIWFNQAREDDWRVDSSSASLEAYRAVVNCVFYGGRGPCPGGSEGRLSVHSIRVPATVGGAVRGAVSFALSETAEVQIKVIPLQHARHAVSIVRKGRAGRNRVPLARVLKRRHLHAGRYRVVLRARNESERSPRRVVHFRVVERVSGRGPDRPGAAARLRLGRPRG